MRIFVAVRHALNPAEYYGDLWSGNFYPAIRRLGHEIVEAETDLLPASRFMHIARNFTPSELQVRERITNQIVDEVRRAHERQPIDLMLTYFYNAHFDPAGFVEIHRLGIPTVNFYCNSIYQFELVADIAPAVTYAWHAEKDARPLYLGVRANPIWVQMGADPDVYYPIPVAKRTQKACFLGQRYADRDRWMASLIQAGIPVAIYGPGWAPGAGNTPNDQPPPDEYLGRKRTKPGSLASYIHVMQQNITSQGVLRGGFRTWKQIRYQQETRQLAPLFYQPSVGPTRRIKEVFSEHEVILNFSNVWADGRPGSRLIPHVRLRDFEAPMCRTCYLTGYTEEITEFYQPGSEIDTYRSPEELIEKIQFYLRHPDAAERLRDAGYQRALQCHTWKDRFAQLFEAIKLR